MSFLAGLHYELGEQELAVDQLPEFEAVCTEHKLPRAAALFGWGAARKTLAPISLATSSIMATLSKATREDVDLLIVATSGLLLPFAEQNAGLGKLLAALEVNVGEILCLSGAGCASGVNALVLADKLVSAGSYSEVMVVCLDAFDASIAKFTEYAVFSDGVASFLVTKEPEYAEFEVESSFKQIFVEEMLSTNVAVQKQGGIKDYLGAAAKRGDTILSNNVFLPVKKMKDSQFGFKKDQLFLKNVTRAGHCVTSDCFINLRDFRDAFGLSGSHHVALHADAAGHASAVAVRILAQS